MRELKVGMRGRVYGYSVVNAKISIISSNRASITHIYPDGWLDIEIESLSKKEKGFIHALQFRPFKPKKPLRELWICMSDRLVCGFYKTKEEAEELARPRFPNGDIVLFREVRERKK